MVVNLNVLVNSVHKILNEDINGFPILATGSHINRVQKLIVLELFSTILQ